MLGEQLGRSKATKQAPLFFPTLMSNTSKHNASKNSCFELLFRGRVSPFTSQQRAGQLLVCFPVGRADIPGSLADKVEHAE